MCNEEAVSIDDEIEQMKKIKYREFTHSGNTFYVVQDLEDHKLLNVEFSPKPNCKKYTPLKGSLWKNPSHIFYDKGLILDEQETSICTTAIVGQDNISFVLIEGFKYSHIYMDVLPTADNEV